MAASNAARSGNTFVGSASNANEVDAAFMVVPVKADAAGDKIVMYPVFYIRPELLLATAIAVQAKINFYVTIRHEFQHFLQWTVASGEELKTFELHVTGEKSSVGQCSAIFRNELEAYLAECRLAAKQGWHTTYSQYCEGGEQPKRLAVKLRDMFRKSYYDRTSPECVAAWDAQAK
jgi:hypothetical protein